MIVVAVDVVQTLAGIAGVVKNTVTVGVSDGQQVNPGVGRYEAKATVNPIVSDRPRSYNEAHGQDHYSRGCDEAYKGTARRKFSKQNYRNDNEIGLAH